MANDGKILNRIAQLEENLKNELKKIAESSPSQKPTSNRSDSQLPEDRIKDELKSNIRGDNNIFYFAQYFRPEDKLSFKIIKENDPMWQDGKGQGLKEILQSVAVSGPLQAKGYAEGTQLTKSGGSQYKEKNGLSIPLFMDYFMRMNRKMSQMTAIATSSEALINKKVSDALTKERVRAREAKNLELLDLEYRHKDEKNNLIKKYEQKLSEQSNARIKMKEELLLECQELEKKLDEIHIKQEN